MRSERVGKVDDSLRRSKAAAVVRAGASTDILTEALDCGMIVWEKFDAECLRQTVRKADVKTDGEVGLGDLRNDAPAGQGALYEALIGESVALLKGRRTELRHALGGEVLRHNEVQFAVQEQARQIIGDPPQSVVKVKIVGAEQLVVRRIAQYVSYLHGQSIA